MDATEARRIDAYFSHLATRLGPVEGVRCACVAHMVPNTLGFIPALARVFKDPLVLIKPKSAQRPEASIIRTNYRTELLDREWAARPEAAVNLFSSHELDGGPFVIADIGAYFVRSADEISALTGGRLIGIMEGTENGAVDYEGSLPETVPVATVARSRLKLPEDYLVGSSVVFSVEAVLREQAQILQTRTACVVGYGRVGSAIADILKNRGISTVVHDISPIAMAEAAARGFPVFRRVDAALNRSTLVICATGDARRPALDAFALNALAPGAVVASVTSADTVIDEKAMGLAFNPPTRISDHISRYDGPQGAYFWLVSGGNAANFIHGAVIGPAIQLIEGEKLAALHALATGALSRGAGAGLLEVSGDRKELVAQIWNEHFLDD